MTDASQQASASSYYQAVIIEQRGAIIAFTSILIVLVESSFVTYNLVTGYLTPLPYQIFLLLSCGGVGLLGQRYPDSARLAQSLLGLVLFSTYFMALAVDDYLRFLPWWGCGLILTSFTLENRRDLVFWLITHVLVVLLAMFNITAPVSLQVEISIAGAFLAMGFYFGFIANRRQLLLSRFDEAATEVQKLNEQLQAIASIEAMHIGESDSGVIFDNILALLLKLTNSEYGFIGEAHKNEDQQPYLRTRAITDISWDDASRDFYTKSAPEGLVFSNLASLFGAVLTTGKVIMTNKPDEDPRSCGLPVGHPPLVAFLGIPIYANNKLIGMIGVANRPQGYDQSVLDAINPAIHTLGVILGALRDRQDRQAVEEALQHAQRIEALGELTGGVAHDFNNILAIQLGNIELLEQTIDDPAALQKIDVIKQSIDRGSSLISQLLAFSRRQPLLPVPVDLHLLLPGVRNLLSRTLGETVQLTVKCSPTLWHTKIDPHQLEGALVNLGINARDAMPQGGTLDISAVNWPLAEGGAAPGLPAGDYIKLSITDSGEGMSREVMSKAFEPFFTTKEHGKGSGLGLSMVYGFVNQSGGHITLASAPGEGANVTILLPRCEKPAAQPALPSTDTPRRAKDSRRILIIEDEAQVLEVMIDLICDLGFEVVSATNGKAALALVNASLPFDLILSDIMLPGGLTGLDIATKIRESRPEQKFLFTSGYAGETLLADFDVDLAANFIAKPFRTRELLDKIEALVQQTP
jgi:signal transduction histidine kinase/ActR/RegA family two-component response regulator